MGTPSFALIKPRPGLLRKFQTGWALILGCWLVSAAGGALAANGVYETWSSDSFTLAPRESFQLRLDYEQIPVRSWKLVVDGGDQNCDVLVTRLLDNSLMYQENDQRHHEVVIPWGKGEELSIVITARKVKGAFVVSVLGPPKDQIHASYSYHVNRALEKFAAGRRLAAEDECRKALLKDPDDGVALVLLAGFLRDRQYFDRATVLVDEALEKELPGNMRSIAESMRQELIKLRAPLPLPVRKGLEEVEGLLIDGQADQALVVCDKLLAGDLELTSASRSRLLMLRGQSLDQLDRNFEALDAFTEALQLNRKKETEGIIYFHMGRLFYQMENLPQAEGAFTMALQHGLPSGLEVQAREVLQTITDQLSGQR